MEFLRLLESIRTPALTAAANILSLPGGLPFFLAVFAVIYWCIDKKTAARTGFSFIIAANLICFLQIALNVQRPYAGDTSFTAGNFFPAVPVSPSMPSLLAGTAALLGIVFIKNFGAKKVKLLFILIPVLTVFSGMYLGAGTPWDMAAGAVIGIIIPLVIDKIFNDITLDRSHYFVVSGILLILPVAVLIIALSKKNLGSVSAEEIRDAVKTAGASMSIAVSWYFEEMYIKVNVRTDSDVKQLAKALIGLIVLGIMGILTEVIYGFTGSWFSDFALYFISGMALFTLYPIYIKKYFSGAYSS